MPLNNCLCKIALYKGFFIFSLCIKHILTYKKTKSKKKTQYLVSEYMKKTLNPKISYFLRSFFMLFFNQNCHLSHISHRGGRSTPLCFLFWKTLFIRSLPFKKGSRWATLNFSHSPLGRGGGISPLKPKVCRLLLRQGRSVRYHSLWSFLMLPLSLDFVPPFMI